MFALFYDSACACVMRRQYKLGCALRGGVRGAEYREVEGGPIVSCVCVCVCLCCGTVSFSEFYLTSLYYSLLTYYCFH